MSQGSWSLVREARDDSWPNCVYFRVHTVYNAKTKLYILWVNLNGGPANFAIGTSATPEGPFKFVHAIDVGRKSGGDFDILVDDDGAAYIIYTATSLGHTMAVEKLTDDYLQSAAVKTPAPTPPPTPPAPVAGFKFIGQGACRDDNGKEPGFETNEPAHKLGTTRDVCAADCKAEESCAAFSYCDHTQPACVGACHLYMPTKPSTMNNTWAWDGNGGGTLPVSKVTGEEWWSCWEQAKGESQEGKNAALTQSSASYVPIPGAREGSLTAPSCSKVIDL